MGCDLLDVADEVAHVFRDDDEPVRTAVFSDGFNLSLVTFGGVLVDQFFDWHGGTINPARSNATPQ